MNSSIKTANKYSWQKFKSFEPKEKDIERWVVSTGDSESSFDLDVTYGKRTDIVSLKRKVIDNFEGINNQIRKENEYLFNEESLERVETCPICNSVTDFDAVDLKVYGGTYVVCSNCTHRYVSKRPTKEALDKFYAKNDVYQAIYADASQLQERIDSIAVPKLNWAIQAYKKYWSVEPKSILDVGAGSGHFVAAARQKGLVADGVELSAKGVGFAKDNLNIDLFDIDFILESENLAKYDLITFWGVIEHVPQPLKMLETAKKHLNEKGLIVAEIPRWTCLGTEMQKLYPDNIVRHLVPNSHIHMFTDSSVATSFVMNDFKPIAAWFYGMDAYEASVQFLNNANSLNHMYKIKKEIEELQDVLDRNNLGDSLVLAGVPS